MPPLKADMLKIHNTLTRQKQQFVPIVPGQVGLYVCGMTVYDYCHLGHARVLVVFDMVARWLRASGYRVTYVRNITDIDDKIIRRAGENHESIRQLTDRFISCMNQDAAALDVLKPDFEPRATEFVGAMQEMISALQARGYAYLAASRDVCYSVRKFVGYGKLSGKSLEDLRAGERVDIAEGKQDPLDFVLWKHSKPEEPAEAQWDSPWGRGRPGWHIECSAMSSHLLGKHFDIHGGGQDLQFPHHENEIAQSEGAHHNHPLAKVWMHNGFLQLQGEKMSKSAGNFFTIRELLADWPGEVLRFNMLRSHYRQPIDFTFEGLRESWKTLERWYEITEPLADPAPDADFFAALRDDLNTPAAIASLHQAEPSALAGGLGFLGFSNVQMKISTKTKVDEIAIADAIEARKAARAAKNFAESDRIRDELLVRGIVLKDGPEGTTWEIKK